MWCRICVRARLKASGFTTVVAFGWKFLLTELTALMPLNPYPRSAESSWLVTSSPPGSGVAVCGDIEQQGPSFLGRGWRRRGG